MNFFTSFKLALFFGLGKFFAQRRGKALIFVKYERLTRAPKPTLQSHYKMYNLNELPEKEQELLTVLSLLPSESISVETLGLLTPAEDWKDTFETFVEKEWVRFDKGEESFSIKSEVHEVACGQSHLWLKKDSEPLLDRILGCLGYKDPKITDDISLGKLGVFAHYAANLITRLKERPSLQLCQLSERLGFYYTFEKNTQKALGYFTLNNTLSTALYEAQPENEDFKFCLASSFTFIGEAYYEMGKERAFLENTLKASQLLEKLLEASPSSERVKSELIGVSTKLAGFFQAKQDYGKALEYSKFANKLFHELYKVNAKDERLKLGLATSHLFLGSIYEAQKSFTQTVLHFKCNLQLTKELYEGNAMNIDTYFESLYLLLHSSYARLIEMLVKLEKSDEAISYLEQSAKVAQATFSLSGSFEAKKNLKEINAKIEALKK